MTTTTPPGALFAFTDVDPDHEDEFNQWYNTQHLKERLAVSGFRSARRYVSLGGGTKYMAFYETDSVSVLGSPAYREVLNNPTSWTQRTMPWFRNMLRSCSSVNIDKGTGLSGCLLVTVFSPRDDAVDDLRRWLREDWSEKLMEEQDVLRVRLCETDHEITGGPNREVAMRGGQDRPAGWTLMIDVIGEAAAARVLQRPVVQSLNAEPRVTMTIAPTLYGLLCCLQKGR